LLALLGSDILEEPWKIRASHNSDERLRIATDQELDELDVVGALERRPQRGLELAGGHLPAAARVRVRSDECERKEWSCLLVARLKVCNIAERGPGGGHTSSSRLARGVGGGG